MNSLAVLRSGSLAVLRSGSLAVLRSGSLVVLRSGSLVVLRSGSLEVDWSALPFVTPHFGVPKYGAISMLEKLFASAIKTAAEWLMD